MMPIISQVLYCSSPQSERVLVVRRRPHVVNGGGFVVTDSSTHRIVFKVDGYGVRGRKPDLILRDGDGDALLLLRPKGGIIEALSSYRKWRGYNLKHEGSEKKELVFRLNQPKSCLVKKNAIRICTHPRTIANKGWDFEIKGCYPDKSCTIVDSMANVVAQVGVKKEVEELMESKDLYHVVVKPGIDQVIVFGVIATLDYIYRQSSYY